ncbi:MAG: glycoside hydrolase family 10 protein, partial [Muribaculaceae bacterium]
MNKKLFSLLALVALTLFSAFAQNPKREFRGAWIHTVHQGQYARMTPAETRDYLKNQLDLLQDAGVNAVIFQVRPSADAFYKSSLEPWSRFLTGVAGKAPVPDWDPLQFMIEESHKRGMELHAWLNPYRVTTS